MGSDLKDGHLGISQKSQEGKEEVIDRGRDDDLTYSLRGRQGASILNINLKLRMN